MTDYDDTSHGSSPTDHVLTDFGDAGSIFSHSGGIPFHQFYRIFGERPAVPISHVDALPQRVVQLYAELKKLSA
jgi:hypothetical protein